LQFDHPEELSARTDGNGTHVWVADSGTSRAEAITTHNSGTTWAYTTARYLVSRSFRSFTFMILSFAKVPAMALSTPAIADDRTLSRGTDLLR
jgi:hypothetical protein